ncbi:hypothetical protein [Dethiobacter alkaliphilus]|uniref:hypothetical protein n=1 Tax=Dethiobacter alkaliphilus TaxID=427926 RepID=UPI002226F110|nr:hypothetical protein [Dethiobacter alkaliphilus]MCW3488669.1 hypothetical protein [Dethiobacter alkaliphilus]
MAERPMKPQNNANNPLPAGAENTADTDIELESFLHLLDNTLALPRGAVKPERVKLRLDQGEKKK